MKNLEAIKLVEEQGIEVTYKGIPVDPTPCDNNTVALVSVEEPNEKHLSNTLVIVVSTENFLKTTLNKKGKF